MMQQRIEELEKSIEVLSTRLDVALTTINTLTNQVRKLKENSGSSVKVNIQADEVGGNATVLKLGPAISTGRVLSPIKPRRVFKNSGNE